MDNPFLAFLRRVVNLFWVVVWIAAPLVALSLLVISYCKRRQTKDRDEIKFWKDQGRLGWTGLYVCVFGYVWMFQDILVYPFNDIEAARHWIQLAFSVPGYFWFVLFHGGEVDLISCDIASFIIMFLMMVYYMIKDWLKVNGDHDANLNWNPTARINKRRREQWEKDEAPFRVLSRQYQEMQRRHPKNLEGWKGMSKAKQDLLVEEWEEEEAALRAEMDRCPRSQVFNRK
ncbi:hypothetical protein WN982_04285 [Paraburkholderia sp. IMGN_8]|uniref:hypothetical protein n=1 Tax=Paraburkholderia sp. IMGN_8 TaxID=3136564 RepID=UPI00310192E3